MTRNHASRKWASGFHRGEAGETEFSRMTPLTETPAFSLSQSNVWVVVLAGGCGTRLQAFIRQFLGSDRPKQFCRIIGSRSMLRHTWDRAAHIVPSDRIVTVITAGQEDYLEEEARLGVPGSVLVQPANKETAPGLLLPLLWIARRSPGATVVVYPADHFIWEEERFARFVRVAVAAAEHLPRRLILLAVEACDPEPSYGWIAPAAPVLEAGAAGLYEVRRFWEKPDRHTADQLFARGYFWNTLVLAGRLDTYLRLADNCIPEVLAPLRNVVPHLDTPEAVVALAGVYRHLRPTNLSRAVLGECPEALLLQAVRNVYWSDWGDPDRIVRTLRRFQRCPTWFPSYAKTPGAMDTGGLPGAPRGLEGGHAVI